jgi:hypothetical protein
MRYMLTLHHNFFSYMFMQTDGRKDGQTYVTKLIVAFHNFAKAPKSGFLCAIQTTYIEIQKTRF